MSKIRIKGDTSGYVDLETSATGSNLSIGGNTTVTGTAAITGPATISGPSNYEGLVVENTATDFAGAYMKIRDGNSTAGQYTWIGRNSNVTYVQSSNSNMAMQFTNDGYVTTPNQPVFSYLGSKSYVIGATGDQIMSSSNVWASNVNHGLNRGSNFNASNGRFTAPVDGTYAFHFKCQASNFSSGYLWFYFKVNGSTKSYAQKSQEAAHTAMTHHMIVELTANDYVTSEWTNNYVSGQIHYPSFSGYLIG
tara:strand:- start:25 stop:774 length:750 start_codon:yes stop_codon:yes gene_type:complete